MERLSLEKFLHEKMPLARAMGVTVLRADEAVELGCPLKANHNHLGTAFGGSLGALMIFAAYCRMFQIMKGQGHAVLKASNMEFMAPVNQDLRAVCLAPPPGEIKLFLDAYNRKGKGRLSLTSEILLQDGSAACRMTAEFVGRT